MSQYQSLPGSFFGATRVESRPLDQGMGVAVARRTVFRPEDSDDFGRVADRVAIGNFTLLTALQLDALLERRYLRNAIATGALLTSGRHLQHGDKYQHTRNLEIFTNCATAITSFAKFYLLLNGSGVGRSYDDELIAVDWANAPDLYLRLPPGHVDYPKDREALFQFAMEFRLVPFGMTLDDFDKVREASVREALQRILTLNLAGLPENVTIHRVGDSREGWAKAVELLETLAYQVTERGKALVLDFSDVRPAGAPINGMQGRPASGPMSLIRAFNNIRDQVILPARQRDPALPVMRPWEQAMVLDHILSVEVQVGGARRAARMATKSWYDPDILRFIKIKTDGGLWTANNSVMVDERFWSLVRGEQPDHPLSRRALDVFNEVTRCAYINGEPGFINGDKLEDHRTGSAWRKPIYADGSDFGSMRYRADYAASMMAELSRRAHSARFPATTNPCGEIVLHTTGGYCTIADFAPLLACPVPIEGIMPGYLSVDVAEEWDHRVEDAVRLGVRFLVRVNLMDALYGKEVARTNRIGIGPTGLHEWAWVRFGLGFRDLLEPFGIAGEFWNFVNHLSDLAKAEASRYALELGTAEPVTVTTIKPAGTTSKLWGLTEGAHLPARRQYLRWVQFKGGRDWTGDWLAGSDPLLAKYQAKGYPIRELHSFQGMSVVGFPTLPLLSRLGLGDKLVTAPEATPEEQYRWLRLLERYWIGRDRGNQVSYTLKVYTDRVDLDAFRSLLIENQPTVRCCSVMPTKPDHETDYEYLPEEEVSEVEFADIVSRINDPELRQSVDLVHLQCASGACPL